jgi:spore maturation protein CgeB
LIVTGFGSVEADTIQRLKSLGILCVNISTDDPWNPVHRAKWRFQALSEYDIVFTPRRSNIQDIVALGCPRVEYLPFGYDEAFFFPPQQAPTDDGPDVLFVGGADQDRTAFLAAFSHPDARLSLAGAYWERHPAVPGVRLGALKPDALRVLTAAAKVNLCLVRRANRDGHVMRSFEIAACGGCMLVEDTAEHRDIFGADGDCVAYFTSPEEAQARARALLSDGRERERMSHAVVKTIQAGRHTYRDRLESILSIAGRVTTESIRHA